MKTQGRRRAPRLAASLGAGLFGGAAAGWLMPVLAPYRHRLGLLLALGMVAAGLGLVPPYLSKLVIDQGLVAGDVQALVRWSAMLFAIGLAAVGMGALNNILHMRASVRMLADLRRVLLDALIARPSHWFGGQRAGELLARIDGDAGEVQQFAFNAVLGGLSAVVRLVGGTVMLMVLNWKLGLLAAMLAPVELLFLAWARPRTERLAGETRTARGHLTAGLAEALHGLPALQISGGTGWARSRSLSDQSELNDRQITQQKWGEFTRAVPQILSALLRAGVFVAGGVMVIRGDWPLGSLIAFIAYMGFMVGPMQSLLGLWHAQARAKVALGRLDMLMAMPARPKAAEVPEGFDLQLENLRFGRDPSRPSGPISGHVPEGTKLALTGPSGSGKTSLLMLLLGRERPLSGHIRLAGLAPDRIAPDALARRIAFVTQRPFTVRASLRDNLFLPRDTPDNAVWEVLDVLDLSTRFRAAEGLDTVLGENGLTLSGGERQRICLARALLRPFDVLILDEALSEVDTETVTRIMAFIDREYPDRTRIVVSHGRLQAFGDFDVTLDLGCPAQ